MIVPFQPWHLEMLTQNQGAHGRSFLNLVDAESANQIAQTPAWSLVQVPGGVLASGGVMSLWPGRYLAWLIATPEAGRYMTRITRAAKATIESIKGRIECTVQVDFEAGHRWAKLLGFDVENYPGVLRQYGPDGSDHIAYVRIN